MWIVPNLNQYKINLTSDQTKAKNQKKIFIKVRKCIVCSKYGYSDFAIWFQEESFFNYWQVHCNGRGVPLYEINLAKRRKLRGESKNQTPESDDQKSESDIQTPSVQVSVR